MPIKENAVKERPILFSAMMVRAILEGRKIQTRRLIKPQPSPDWRPVVGHYSTTVIDRWGDEEAGPEVYGASDEDEGRVCPFGKPGDRLWVREAFSFWLKESDRLYDEPDYENAWYRADADAYGLLGHDSKEAVYVDDLLWKPSIHMPRSASRITLEINNIRVQRVKDITPAECVCEGYYSPPGTRYAQEELKALDWFTQIWMDINGKDSWIANPWVWVVEFRRMSLSC